MVRGALRQKFSWCPMKNFLINQSHFCLLLTLSSFEHDNALLDSLFANLTTRMESYVKVEDKFSFITKLNKLNIDQNSIASRKIASFYENDSYELELISECEIAKHYFFTNPDSFISHISIFPAFIKINYNQCFPNIEIMLRIFTSLFITNGPGERSYFKIKIHKRYIAQLNSMLDEKLNAFALISIENDILDSLDMEQIIEEFLLLKNRKN